MKINFEVMCDITGKIFVDECDVESVETAREEILKMLDRFNNSRRLGESPRTFIRIVVFNRHYQKL